MQVKPHPFIGLDLDFQVVGLRPLGIAVTKLRIRRWLEADGDFGITHAHPLAGTQVKWHPDPSPVVDHDFQRNIGFGLAMRANPGLIAIPRQFLAPLFACRVLPTHRIFQSHGHRPRPDSPDHLGLFAAHGIGAKRRWRLHGNHRQQLEQVIWHHVPQCPGVIVKPATAFHADGFGCGDLHMINVVIIPEGLEQAVGEAADKNVLHRLFAQVVVDAVDLLFAHHREQRRIQRLSAGQVGTERFFHHNPTKAVGFVEQPCTAQLPGHLGEKTRRGSQIEDGIARAALVDPLCDGLIGGRGEEIASQIMNTPGQAPPSLFIKTACALITLVAFTHEGFQTRGKLTVGGRVVIDPDNTHARVKQAITLQVEQGRHQQTFDQIAIGTKQKQRARCSGFSLG